MTTKVLVAEGVVVDPVTGEVVVMEEAIAMVAPVVVSILDTMVEEKVVVEEATKVVDTATTKVEVVVVQDTGVTKVVVVVGMGATKVVEEVEDTVATKVVAAVVEDMEEDMAHVLHCLDKIISLVTSCSTFQYLLIYFTAMSVIRLDY
eukprot:g45979.t1